eukprot:EG_transcript_53014
MMHNEVVFARPASLEVAFSDCGSSEGPSSESAGGTPTRLHSTSELGFLSRLGQDVLAHRRNAHHGAAVLGDAPAAPPATPAGEKQQLCLDFLNGKCGRHRSRCRYYHPEASEITMAPATSSPLEP